MTTRSSVSFDPIASRSRVSMTIVSVVLALIAAGVLTIVLRGVDASPTMLPVADATDERAADGEVDDAVDDLDTDGEVAIEDEVATGDDVVALPLRTVEVLLARDPFDPVVPSDIADLADDGDPDAADPDDPAAPTDPDAGTQPDPVDPDGPSAPVDPGDGARPGDPSLPPGPATPPGAGTPPGTPACVGEQEVVCDGQVVTLVDVTTVNDEDIAVIQIDTNVYEVTRGQVFATYFQLRSIDGQCVSLLYGDDGFQLCAGDTVLK